MLIRGHELMPRIDDKANELTKYRVFSTLYAYKARIIK